MTKMERASRPGRRKGAISQRVRLVRSVVREVAGFAPYEKRIIEILRGGGGNPTKRAARFAKNRLGSGQRAKKKCAELSAVIADATRIAAQKQAAAAKAKKEKEAAAPVTKKSKAKADK